MAKYLTQSQASAVVCVLAKVLGHARSLATSLVSGTYRKIIDICAKRWAVKAGFRHIETLRFGMELGRAHIQNPEHPDRLRLINAIVITLLIALSAGDNVLAMDSPSTPLPSVANEAPLTPVQDKHMSEMASTPDEIINNINVLFKENLLFDQSTYELDRLKSLFGGQNVDATDYHNGQVRFTIDHLGKILEHSDEYSAIGVTILITKDASQDNRISKALLNFTTAHDTRITADKIISVFGPDYVLTNPFSHENPYHPRALQPKTAALGNMDIQYESQTDSFSGLFNALVNGDGTINYMTLKQERK